MPLVASIALPLRVMGRVHAPNGPAERVLSEPPRGSPPIEARIYLTRSRIVSLVSLGWITANRPLAAAVSALAETALLGLRPTP